MDVSGRKNWGKKAREVSAFGFRVYWAYRIHKIDIELVEFYRACRVWEQMLMVWGLGLRVSSLGSGFRV